MNRSADTTPARNGDRIARAAWFCAFVLPLILAGLLLCAMSAEAATPAEAAASVALVDEFEVEVEAEGSDEDAGEEELSAEDEAELVEEECAIAREEAAEGELSGGEARAICREAEEAATGAGPGSAADQCPLRSAHAQSAVRDDRIKLTVGYTTTTPVSATIQLSGPVRASYKRHLGRSGVLRFTERAHGRARSGTVVRIKLPPEQRAACPSGRLVLLAR